VNVIAAMAAHAEPEYRRPWSLKSFPIPVDSQASYIGFEIESSCTDIGFIPHEQRERKIVRIWHQCAQMSANAVSLGPQYVFGKERSYFDPQQNDVTWSNETYERIASNFGLVLEAGILDNGEGIPIPNPITNVGTETRKDFMKRLGGARLILGTGRPHESPTPM
jgi:hypothetical protein